MAASPTSVLTPNLNLSCLLLNSFCVYFAYLRLISTSWRDRMLMPIFSEGMKPLESACSRSSLRRRPYLTYLKGKRKTMHQSNDRPCAANNFVFGLAGTMTFGGGAHARVRRELPLFGELTSSFFMSCAGAGDDSAVVVERVGWSLFSASHLFSRSCK